MTTLLKGKSDSIVWNRECDLNFSTLKLSLTHAPILTIIDPLKGNIVLCTDASDLAIGVVLMQYRKVVVFESRKLNHVELNYPTHKKELLMP